MTVNRGEETAVTVSVIIPAYNQAQYLAEAIESVVTQSVRDFEIIVVDDGSTDETAAVAQAYGGSVRTIWQENQGLAGARNTGIQVACGQYVALLDSDDAWQPQYLEKMLALAAQRPNSAVFYCGVQYMDNNSCPLPQTPQTKVVPETEMYDVMLRANFLVPSTIMMRREAVTAVGLFDPAFRRLQDWELWVRFLRQGYEISGLPEPLIRYRVHDESLSTDPTGGQRAAEALALKHFGPDDGCWDEWPTDKRRMYGGLYRYHALTSSLLRAHDWLACADYLRLALQVDPSLAEDLDLFYELALGIRPLGWRNNSGPVDMAQNERHVADLLAHIFQQPSTTLTAIQAQTMALAYYALGMVAYNTNQLAFSRRFLWKSVRLNPSMYRHKPKLASLLRTFGGRAFRQIGRKLLRSSS